MTEAVRRMTIERLHADMVWDFRLLLITMLVLFFLTLVAVVAQGRRDR